MKVAGQNKDSTAEALRQPPLLRPSPLSSPSTSAHQPLLPKPPAPSRRKMIRHQRRHSGSNQQRNWVAEICSCLGCCTCLQQFWPKVVMRKLLNISSKNSDYSADEDEDDDECGTYLDSDAEETCDWPRGSRFKDEKGNTSQIDSDGDYPRSRRRKSETFRAQYINAKELRVSVGTWNVGGKLPPDDLDIGDWLDSTEPADIYVIGLQEIIPLNAGNIFGAEDSRPVTRWENIIRQTLNKVQPVQTKFKCYSDPPSPSRFRPADDAPVIEEEVLLESESEDEEEIYPLNEESSSFDEVRTDLVGHHLYTSAETPFTCDHAFLGTPVDPELGRQFSSPKKLDRLDCLREEVSERNEAAPISNKTLTKMLSGTERIGLSWPEPPMDLLGQCVLERRNSFKSIRSFKTSKSFRTYESFKSYMDGDNRVPAGAALLAELDIDSILYRRRRPPYARIVSKQMVGIFLTIWVRRSLRKHIQNINVSTVGVGAMGYIGNKGSISVSMSVYQTLFCFVCTHLTAGEKDGDVLKRNSAVHEIQRRTHFNSFSSNGLPKSIKDHERIIWFGDLNYRINLSYERTREMISKRNWSKLAENDQLLRELRKGRTFEGWSEATLNFPPTYKYELDSEMYYGEDLKTGRRTPAWCDRILSFGKGMKQLTYRRAELKLSDHRPVAATYLVEVEVFCSRKLQRALTFTNAEIENDDIAAHMEQDVGLIHLRHGQVPSDWER